MDMAGDGPLAYLYIISRYVDEIAVYSYMRQCFILNFRIVFD